jgi:predicted dehydrogenase
LEKAVNHFLVLKEKKLKACVVGAGQIAEAHIEEIIKIDGANVVGICDLKVTPAKALAEKYNIKGAYTDIDLMLSVEKPDVVHITTPPMSHFFLANKILDAGSNVYIEKPLTITENETESLITKAQDKGLIICPGTHRLRSFETIAVFEKIRNKDVFGDMIHIDAIFGYNMEGIFGKQILANPEHWIAQLPGQLFHNNISHPLGMVAPFLSDDLEVTSLAYDKSGNGVVNDELRVQIFDRENKITCSILFVSNAKPVQFVVRYLGSKSSISLNLTEHFWIEESNPKLPGGLGLSVNVRQKANQLKKQFWSNFHAFWTGKHTFFSDMRTLIEEFYTAIEKEGKEPVPYRELIITSRVIDQICNQIKSPGAQ